MTTGEKMTREYERAMDEVARLRVECDRLRAVLSKVVHDEHAMERLKVEVERLKAENATCDHVVVELQGRIEQLEAALEKIADVVRGAWPDAAGG